MNKRRLLIGCIILLALLLGPCAAAAMDSLRTPTVEAAYEVGKPVAGYAHGAKWRCGGRFNWRGKYLGLYCVEVPVSTKGAYWLHGRYYMPALKLGNHKPTGWWIRFGYGSWKDSVVKWKR